MSRLMPKAVFAMLEVVLAVLLSSCAGSGNLPPDNGKPVVVDMIVKMDRGDYWKTTKLGAEVAAKEYNVQLNFLAPDNENDVEGQIRLMEESIKRKPDAIVLAATDYEALGQATDRTSYFNIPVISIDSEVASTKVKTYVGTNNYEAGQKAAERLVELTGPDSEIGIINFVKGPQRGSAGGGLPRLCRPVSRGQGR